MTVSADAAVSGRPRWEFWLLAIVVAYFLLLRVSFAIGAFPIADEAYYWMWGRHPALSYFDHPPLNSWILGASHAIFGRSLFALRWPTIAALLAILWVFYRIIRRTEVQWEIPFLRAAVVYLASPVFGFFGSTVFPDYLLVAFLTLSGYFFFVHLSDVEEKGAGSTATLMAGATFLGLAALAKYNAIFVAFAVAAAILIRPRLRPLLRSWQLYAAAALALLIVSPVLVWNAQNGFASIRFHLGDRFAGTGFSAINIVGMKAFLVETMALLSPLLIPPILRFFLGQPADRFRQVARTIALSAFILSTATFLYIANYSWVLWWWNIAAFVLALPFAQRYMGLVMLSLHVIWGGAVSTILMVSYVALPLTMLFGLAPIGEADTAYGWDRLGAAVLEAKRQTGADFIAANSYQRASQLGFALDDPDIAAISIRRDAFDDWFQELAGRDAIVLVDPTAEPGLWEASFRETELLETITTERFGLKLKRYEIYLGRGYTPPP